MTRQRIDNHSTEFGLWLREQKELDSKLHGFVATNLDYIWENYKTGDYMLIEEKRFMGQLTYPQEKLFRKIYDNIAEVDSKFRGFYFIQFEKTNPDDGRIFLDHKEINKDQLIHFLSFK